MQNYSKIIVEINVSVPDWEYCNDIKDPIQKTKFYNIACQYLSKNKECKLFNCSLFTNAGWAQKCDKCKNAKKMELKSKIYTQEKMEGLDDATTKYDTERQYTYGNDNGSIRNILGSKSRVGRRTKSICGTS